MSMLTVCMNCGKSYSSTSVASFLCPNCREESKKEIIAGLGLRVEQAEKEVERYKKWVDDLQAGMYVNCVYCGHRYGPADEVSASKADLLTQHIEKCPAHPMSGLKEENERLKAECASVKNALRWLKSISYSREDDLELWPSAETRELVDAALSVRAGETLLAKLRVQTRYIDGCTAYRDKYKKALEASCRYLSRISGLCLKNLTHQEVIDQCSEAHNNCEQCFEQYFLEQADKDKKVTPFCVYHIFTEENQEGTAECLKLERR